MTNSTTYQHGLLQTVCGMLASAQARNTESGDGEVGQSYPSYGVRVVADCFTFLYCDIPATYINAVNSGYNVPPLTVTAFPGDSRDTVNNQSVPKYGWRFSVEQDRKEIIAMIIRIRNAMIK